jgi:hypothetical protein
MVRIGLILLAFLMGMLLHQSTAFSSKSMGIRVRRATNLAVAMKSMQSREKMALFSAESSGEGEKGFRKWVCPSCSYVYDEEKGGRPKKRYPPGTRWEDIEVFLW